MRENPEKASTSRGRSARGGSFPPALPAAIFALGILLGACGGGDPGEAGAPPTQGDGEASGAGSESGAESALLAQRREQARREILGLAQETGVRTLIIGLDGADWQVIDPLIEKGRLPNLASLRERGSWANLKTLVPILSPLIWTSVATGVTADRHGILDFLVLDERSGRKTPVNSRYRKVRALWNIFSEAERTVDFVAWWASWPAEEVNGHLISDRVSYSLFDLDVPPETAGATYPPDYLGEVQDRLVEDEAISFEEVARFADVTREEFLAERALIGQDRSAAYERPLNHLTKILAATRNYHIIALDLLARGQSDLTAVYYQGIDEIGHRFMHFAPPRLQAVSEEDFRRYARVVEEFYVYQDELIGELLRAVDPETTVIVLSDHGFLNGPDRPQDQTADIEGQPAHWHRLYGVLILAGPPIAAGQLDTASMLDITPTVLRLAGLPVAEDMDGRVLEEALRPEFRERYPKTSLATYESTPMGLGAAPLSAAMAAVDAEVMANLRALGYIGEEAGSAGGPGVGAIPSPTPATGVGDDSVSAHTNLAGVHLAKGELEKAEIEIRAALALAPSSVPARLHLFSLRVRQERTNEALEVASGLIAEGQFEYPDFLPRVAETYVEAGRTLEGIRTFRTAFESGRWPFGGPLSRMERETGDLPGALGTARAVLEHDPLDEAAMATLVAVAGANGNLAAARVPVEKALALNPRSVMHLNWLAFIRASTGDSAGAEALLVQALEIDPDHEATMANLGALYGRLGRMGEAVPLLQRALRIEPENLEARVNLGTSLAKLGRKDEALAQFEEAVERGLRDANLCNMLARAYGERGQVEIAAGWLRRSLEIDPNQPSIRQFLQQVESRR